MMCPEAYGSIDGVLNVSAFAVATVVAHSCSSRATSMRLQLLEARLLGDLVLPLVGVVLQVPHIGYVAHVTHLVAAGFQVAGT